MKIKENYLHEALRADKKDKPSWASEARRQTPAEPLTDAANKSRQTEPASKDDLKFASLLESPSRTQKTNRHDDSRENDGDDKKEQKEAARDKDSSETAVGDEKTEKYESGTGGQSGGQSGFGTGGGVSQLFNLNENFAARSILHIADLERLVSAIRTQIGLSGRREVHIELKRSVLEGLRVKITTEAGGKVGIEFLAATENARAEIEKHSGELAAILRGRGINVEAIKTGVGSGGRGDDAENTENAESLSGAIPPNDESSAEDTFGQLPAGDGTVYNA